VNFKYQKTDHTRQHPIIGWVGRIEENKNWRGFLAIGQRLIKSNPSIKLWMFIDNNLTSPEQGVQFKKLVNKYRIKKHLTIHNNIPNSQMSLYYSNIADSGGFLCSTSKVEGFGYAIVEAMSCKCPVLTTDSDGIKSFVFHNNTGKIYSQGNVDLALQEANSLLNNQILREKICNNALQYVQSQLSPEKYAKNFIEMLRELGLSV
jgi:glycosyltransferase involved in cell wall biosynthesis